MKRVRAS